MNLRTLRPKRRTGADFRRLAAYGWPPGLPDAEILARLLALNLVRAQAAAVQPAAPLPTDFQ